MAARNYGGEMGCFIRTRREAKPKHAVHTHNFGCCIYICICICQNTMLVMQHRLIVWYIWWRATATKNGIKSKYCRKMDVCKCSNDSLGSPEYWDWYLELKNIKILIQLSVKAHCAITRTQQVTGWAACAFFSHCTNLARVAIWWCPTFLAHCNLWICIAMKGYYSYILNTIYYILCHRWACYGLAWLGRVTSGQRSLSWMTPGRRVRSSAKAKLLFWYHHTLTYHAPNLTSLVVWILIWPKAMFRWPLWPPLWRRNIVHTILFPLTP